MRNKFIKEQMHDERGRRKKLRRKGFMETKYFCDDHRVNGLFVVNDKTLKITETNWKTISRYFISPTTIFEIYNALLQMRNVHNSCMMDEQNPNFKTKFNYTMLSLS